MVQIGHISYAIKKLWPFSPLFSFEHQTSINLVVKFAAYKLDSKCESLCEEALEILQEIVAADASLQIWFDRNLDFGLGSLIDASFGNLPRLVTSRSIEKLRGDSRLVKKIDVKISVVERAIYSIGRDTEVSSNCDSFMLEKFLNTDD